MNLIPRNFYLDDFFDEMPVKSGNMMKCDIYEKDGKYHIEMDMPGFSKEDIKLETNDGYVTIKATKKEVLEEGGENKNYLRRERSFGEYERSFYLGEFDIENVDASFKDGVLKVVVPKKEAINNKKTIEIK